MNIRSRLISLIPMTNANEIINVTSPGGIPLTLPSPRRGEDKKGSSMCKNLMRSY